MTGEGLIWPYWSVDLPGLNEANARRLLAWAVKENISLGGGVVNPARSFSIHLDELTAEPLARALASVLDSETVSQEGMDVIRFISELLSEWLSTREGGPVSK